MTVVATVAREGLPPVECEIKHCRAESTKTIHIRGDATGAMHRECDAHVADALDKWGER